MVYRNPCIRGVGLVTTLLFVFLLGGGGQLGPMVQSFQIVDITSTRRLCTITTCVPPWTQDGVDNIIIHHHSPVVSVFHPKRIGSTTSLYGFFGGMFGGNTDKMSKSTERDAVLATYTIVAGGKSNNENDIIQKERSLIDYLTVKWIKLFENGTIKLTTPVDFVTTKVWEPEEGIESVGGVQLLFRKRVVPSSSKGYDNNENDEGGAGRTNDDDNGSNQKKKKDEKKEGGIEILVERLAGSTKGQQQLRVRARRCEVEDGTIIKEMSEETIINELNQAIDAWRKENK